MSDSGAPLHGAQPPRPSIFPVLAVAVLGAGSGAANGCWVADPKLVALAGAVVGAACCLGAMRLGFAMFASRRSGVYAGLLAAASLPILRLVAAEPLWGLALLPALALALGLGRLLDCFSEGRLSPGARGTVRFTLDMAGTLVAVVAAIRLFGPMVGLPIMADARLAPVPLACFMLAGLLIGFMGLAGESRRWPLAEAVLVTAAAGSVWLGLVGN